jgi:hypothetical protein
LKNAGTSVVPESISQKCMDGAEDESRLKLHFYWDFEGLEGRYPNKTEKNRKKPVETDEL